EIVINVSDCHPDFKRGTSIQLLSQGFMPTVDYTNFDDIFKEHYICDSLASFHCKVEMYSASFEIFIEMPAPVKPVKIIFKLAGEGCIPEVTIVLPNEKGRHGHKLLSFCPTILGDVTTRQFSFTNVGVLPCKVILELYLNTGSVFSLYPTHETVPKALMLVPNEPVQYTTIVCLNPGQFATFDVHFQPQHISTYEGEVKLFIVDNPFENLSITLTGEGYMEDITLEGLFPERLSHKSLTQKQEGDFELPCYQLDYGFCYINKIQKRNFKMANHSDSNTYRFEWKPHPNIVISPTIGHLLPKIGKDIGWAVAASVLQLTVTSFINKKRGSVVGGENVLRREKLELQCTIAHINLLSPNLGTTSWDDRQKVMSWRKETNPANSDAGSFNSFMSPELSIAKYVQHIEREEREPEREVRIGAASVADSHSLALN
ncbi:unnamed protein product, partial [Timema podura]|nr:unnamed protein product [Timema podura]